MARLVGTYTKPFNIYMQIFSYLFIYILHGPNGYLLDFIAYMTIVLESAS